MLVFVLVAAIHVRHAWALGGRQRLWHVTHVLMALGMIDMYWPAAPMPVHDDAGTAVFGVAAAVVVILGVRRPSGGEATRWLSALAAVDLCLMAYMFLAARGAAMPVTALFVAWCSIEAAGWLSGALPKMVARAGPGLCATAGCELERRPGPFDSGRWIVAREQARTGYRSSGPCAGPEPQRRMAHAHHAGRREREMGYMLLVMQLAMPAMPSTPGMPGMPGMRPSIDTAPRAEHDS